MTWTEYADLLIRALVVAGAAAGVVQIIKWPMQLAMTRAGRYPESGDERRLWVSGLRFFATVVGVLLALPPGLWPDWLPAAWRPLIGLCAGVSSSSVFDAWIRLVHGTPATIDAAVRARFGASPAADPPLRVTDTGTVETEP